MTGESVNDEVADKVGAAPADSEFGKGLNAAQRQAATYGDSHGTGHRSGPLLVIAGAGTGKTNTLAHRVAFLLMNKVSPERIALMTFSRRAALELLHRAEIITSQTLAGTRAPPLRISSTEGRRRRCSEQ
jgi:DNA helicase-2/ATP-dependent DNA helicase PcrA